MVRAARSKIFGFIRPKCSFGPDPDIPVVFAADSRYSLFVRNIYYTVELYRLEEEEEEAAWADDGLTVIHGVADRLEGFLADL